LLQLSQAALDLLGENETCLLTQAGVVGRTLLELQKVDKSADELVKMHEQAMSMVREVQTALRQYADRLEVDPSRLQQLEERLNLLQSLKRKYGPSIAQVIAFGEDARRS